LCINGSKVNLQMILRPFKLRTSWGRLDWFESLFSGYQWFKWRSSFVHSFINHYATQGETPLYLAIRTGNFEIASFMVAKILSTFQETRDEVRVHLSSLHPLHTLWMIALSKSRFQTQSLKSCYLFNQITCYSSTHHQQSILSSTLCATNLLSGLTPLHVLFGQGICTYQLYGSRRFAQVRIIAFIIFQSSFLC
jgi:hypothetical protein